MFKPRIIILSYFISYDLNISDIYRLLRSLNDIGPLSLNVSFHSILLQLNKHQNDRIHSLIQYVVTKDPGVVSSIPAHSHTFTEIGHDIIYTVILLLPLIQEGLFQLQAKVCARTTG